MRRFAMAGAVLLGTLVSSTTSTLATPEMVSVTIVDAPRPPVQWGYAPTAQEIQTETWVTWSNNGEDAHTVTAMDGSFDSGDLGPSEGFSWFFDQPGTFEYLCALHPWMKGSIVVLAAATPTSDQQLPHEDLPDEPAAQSGD